jgi:hypothetical protein
MRRLGPFTLLVLAVGCGPSPTRVCEHVVEVTRAQSQEAAGAIDLEACTADFDLMRERIGRAQWRELGDCLVQADTLAGMKACDRLGE